MRYSRNDIAYLDNVVSPPYDIISPEQRRELHERHPHNFVRLVLGEDLLEDNESSNRFTRAAEYLRDWLAQGVLAQDPRPAFYVYQQRYSHRGREQIVSGFTCLVKAHEYSDDVILPHEQTLAKPKSELLELMRRTEANLDPIYSLFEDPSGTAQDMISEAVAEPPSAEAHDCNGELHRIWMVDDADRIAAVAKALADQQIFIADGHHRYETALAYRNEMRARNSSGGELPSDYVLMTIVDAGCPDLTVFPTHRVVRNVDPSRIAALGKCLSKKFRLLPSSPASLIDEMAVNGGHALGAYFGGQAYVLRALSEQPVAVAAGEPDAIRRLPVTLLHRVALEECLGIRDEDLRNETNLTYVRDEARAFEMVDSGKYQAAFFLNPTRVQDVINVARSGARMPQKATYFYPKLLSGLVLRLMEW